MIGEIKKLQNPEKYYKALEKLRTGKTYLSVPKNKELKTKINILNSIIAKLLNNQQEMENK